MRPVVDELVDLRDERVRVVVDEIGESFGGGGGEPVSVGALVLTECRPGLCVHQHRDGWVAAHLLQLIEKRSIHVVSFRGSMCSQAGIRRAAASLSTTGTGWAGSFPVGSVCALWFGGG